MKNWKQIYKRDYRPQQRELASYLSPPVMELFTEFSQYLASRYGLSCAPAVYSVDRGWYFKFGRSGIYMLRVYIEDDSFIVEDIHVTGGEKLIRAEDLADTLYSKGFEKKLDEHKNEKSREQAERAKRRREQEKNEEESLSAVIDRDKFNRFSWTKRVSRKRIKKLYELDAKGIRDEELADEIGIAFYVRCLQGKVERDLMEEGKIKCHGCGEVLDYQSGLIQCECGRQYFFREYMRSFRRANMPSGSASELFLSYIEEWPRAKNYGEKMQLIDNLVHEFHINLTTGVRGRLVGINLIEGTKAQIEEFVLSLTYGNDEERQ